MGFCVRIKPQAGHPPNAVLHCAGEDGQGRTNDKHSDNHLGPKKTRHEACWPPSHEERNHANEMRRKMLMREGA